MDLTYVVAGLAVLDVIAAYSIYVVVGQRDNARTIADYEKGRAEQILKELHKAESDATEQYAQDRAYIDTLLDRCDTFKAELDSAKASLASEAEIRISFQNKAAGLERAFEGMRLFASSRVRAAEALEIRVAQWRDLYGELVEKVNGSIQKRDASGRFVKKSA